MNPTNHVLESRYAQLEGGHPLSGLSVSSGTTGEYDFIAYDAFLDIMIKMYSNLSCCKHYAQSIYMHTTSAIFYSIINLASKGDNIVSARALYGGTFTMFNDLLPKFGIEVRFVDAEDPKNFERAMDDKTRAFFCESVSNPALEICDLEVIGTSAHDHGLPLICDSTFSTVSYISSFRYLTYLFFPLSYDASY